ncbi:MAG: bifunctional folylpolyglutamate synthase/dihydrofolate synthase [Planctomycetes bacterium]|nr:bifunctional folylpolyglutamate synthase/dihydrofolate synthase [Planctomycetota bacterium]
MAKTLSSPQPNRAGTRPPPEIATFANAVRYLNEQVNFERMRVVRYDESTFKLERVRKLLRALDNPHEQIRTVHVAGTLGKGSTAAMIAAMLQGCGHAVGLYTSPHLIDIRERITINGRPIGKTDFTKLMRQVSAAAVKQRSAPTFFELLTAMAFRYFADEVVDIAIIETGLGGRLDATNVITPEVTVITRIDYDHMQILGRTLPEIAREKAGILKRHVPALTIEQDPDVDAVLRETAETLAAPYHVIGQDIEFSCRFDTSEALGPHTRVCVLTETSQFMHLPVPLAGEHQALNCGLALATIDTLKASGLSFPEVPLHDGLARTETPGRMELVWRQPRILIDGAHNPAAIKALMRSVGAYVPYDSMICIFGCCQDKDIPALLRELALGGDKLIFTRARGNPRATDPEILHRIFTEQSSKMSQIAATLPDALELATRAVGRDDLICITGSFYLAGEAKKHLEQLARKRQSV